MPTFAKQDYPQVNLLASVAFLAPKGVPEASAKILTEAIRKTLQESKLQENLKSRGYNIDLRTTTADLKIDSPRDSRCKTSVGSRNTEAISF